MKFRILQGNVFDTLPQLEPGSIDCAVTSPPYWMLRSYLPKNHALKPLELGLEKTPQEFVANMVRVFGLVREALADHGTCWVNIGDTYAHDGKWGGKTGGKHRSELHGMNGVFREARADKTGLGCGNRVLIPERLALALQEDGWIVRSVIVWHKPAPMPASLTGWQWRRCRVRDPEFATKTKKYVGKESGNPSDAGERMKLNTATARALGGAFHDGANGIGQHGWLDCPGCKKCRPNGGLVLRRGSWRPTSSWEPILMLAKSADYFADGEAVKQPPAAATVSRDQYTRVLDDPDEQFAVKHDHETVCDGANLRDVWTIASEPLREKHYAAFPTRLVENCLKAGVSARGYCPACGAPWCRVVGEIQRGGCVPRSHREAVDVKGGNQAANGIPEYSAVETIDWRQSCSCPPADPRPGRVLDPFAGSGRTLLTARRLGFDAVGCELNPEYVAMATRLLTDDMPLFAATTTE